MNYKHTQGEWGVDYGGGTLVYAVDCGTTICEINHYRRNGGEGDEQPEDEAEANAKLIASAPKLLEALRQFIHSVEHEGLVSGRVVDAVRHANEVINNATNV